MTSTDQGQTDQSTEDQSTVASDEVGTQSQQNESEEIISKAEYKKLQAEYTKSRQELSEFKKTSELSEDDKAAIAFMKKNNFLTKEDLEGYKAEKDQDSKIWKIISQNPDLKANEAAIRDLSKSTWLAPEDVIEKYGFKSKDKLAKAKAQGDIKWWPEVKPKTLNDMSVDEYEKWRQSKWIWLKWKFS